MNEVKEEFPLAQIHPLRGEFPAHSERTMTVLPLQLDPGLDGSEVAVLGWTPLRLGLALTARYRVGWKKTARVNA